ncbi:hypothetical protein GIB67_003298 [Kingdonia uniflora]|uniref:Reverse transcriptase zinc-binding domain-containing protein n=1 Tax=Kingdonia uniflora TaxID=39325 RepID=A0A7J7P8Z1_9MAGN|nr:hypothetical protein GIB67_003298 [Kingdonia uniflora]
MLVTKGFTVPSHLLFADDIFVFVNGYLRGLKILKKWLIRYQDASGQVFSETKSKIFMGMMMNEKKERIKGLFGFSEGSYPENYLGIPLMQGRVTKATLRPLLEKINKRASGWAGSMLSIQGRAVLVKSVLSSLSTNNMGIYKWPMSIVKERERILRNFLWSGNSAIKKSCVVGWNKTCKPRKEGGIDIRSLKEVNLALLMKLAWNFLNGQDDWAKFMRAKFNTKAGNRIYSTQESSVWAGIRGAVSEVEQRSGWIVGDGKDIDLWRNNWCHQRPLKDLIDSNDIPWHCFRAKAIRNKGQPYWWSKYVYRQAIHPRLSLWGWRMMQNCLPTDENIKKRDIPTVSRCCLCLDAEDSSEHLFWNSLVQGLACAASNGWEIAWLESDSSGAVKAFNNNLIPWNLENVWIESKKKMKKIRITSTWREANFSADILANRETRLLEGITESIIGKPHFLKKIEIPMCEYFRFV